MSCALRTLLLAACLAATTVQGQPGTLDPSFDPAASTSGGISSSVLGMAVQADGRIVVVGGFTSCQGQPRGGVARLLPDGSLDASFQTGMGVSGSISLVAQVVLDADGRIVIGGDFCFYNGVVRNGVARLNTDGSLDTTFVPGSGPNGPVYALAHHPGDGYLIGGTFNNVDGIARLNLARLHHDGSLDLAFNPGGGGADATVRCVAAYADSSIFIGGEFQNYNGAPAPRLAKVSPLGVFDSTFAVGTGADGNVLAVSVQSDQKAIIGGAFTTVNGQATGGAARLLSDGSVDAGFMAGAGANGTVHVCHAEHGGTVLLGGSFAAYNSTPRPHFVRLLDNGTVDAGFVPDPGPDNDLRTLVPLPDGKIMVGGLLTEYDALVRRHVARVNGSGNIGLVEPQATVLWAGPNPTADQLTVHLSGDAIGALLHVFDATGQLVLAHQAQGNTAVLPTRTLAPGCYALRTSGAALLFIKE